MPKKKKSSKPPSYPDSRRAKPPFPINLIFNVRAIYVLFIVALIGGVAASTLVGLGGSSSERRRQVVEETVAPTGDDLTGAAGIRFEAPEQVVEEGGQYEAVLTTYNGGQEGQIRIQLFADQAPRAVNSFVFLAQRGFYDDLLFFFVRQDFVAQAGDPTCDSSGERPCTGAGGVGYTLPFEQTDVSHVRGALVLPALIEGEEVHGSQFRILLADDLRLDGKETVFGKVVSGLDVLEEFGDTIPCFGRESTERDPCQELDPSQTPAITSVEIRQTSS